MALPETLAGLKDAGYVFDNDAKCRGCGEPIEWWITKSGRRMPISVVEVKDKPVGPIKEFKRVSHFAVCPNADDFRRK